MDSGLLLLRLTVGLTLPHTAQKSYLAGSVDRA
jgi:hypothetical protein